MKDKLLEIVNYYGLKAQLKYIHSEYYELDEAILNYENYEDLVDIEEGTKNSLKIDIIGEIADIMVMLKQIQYYYKIEDKQIEEIMEHKIDRQLERIDADV